MLPLTTRASTVEMGRLANKRLKLPVLSRLISHPTYGGIDYGMGDGPFQSPQVTGTLAAWRSIYL